MKIKIICKHCKKSFEIPDWDIKQKRKFCSQKCSQIFRKNKTYKEFYGKEKGNVIANKIRNKNKNRTYDEIFGKEKAKIIRLKHSKSMMGKPSFIKNKTYEEVFGIEKAKERKKYMSNLLKGHYVSDESRKKMKDSHINKTHKEIFGVEGAFKRNKKFKQTMTGRKRKKDIVNKIIATRKINDNYKQTEESMKKRKETMNLKYDLNLLFYGKKNPKNSIHTKNQWKNNPKSFQKKRVSYQQQKLFNLCIYWFDAKIELEYFLKTKIKNRFIDIAFPKYKVAIEYDGDYWHQDKKKDEERDKEIEDMGWKIFHYNKWLLKIIKNAEGENSYFIIKPISKLFNIPLKKDMIKSVEMLQ